MNFFEKIKEMNEYDKWTDVVEAKLKLYWKYYHLMVLPLRELMREK